MISSLSVKGLLREFTLLIILCVLACIFAACSAPSDSDVAETNAETQTIPIETTAASDPDGKKTETEIQNTPSETPAPEKTEQNRFSFHTTDLDGTPVDESIFEGYDLVMLNFWAYWCPPCVQEIPELEKLHQAYPKVLLLGVIVDDSDMQETFAILENAGATYRVLYPEGDLAALAENCQYIPTTFFLKPNGMLIGEPVIGSNDYDGWSSTVEGLLK